MNDRSPVQQVCSNAYFEVFANEDGDLSVALERNSVGEFICHVLNEIDPAKNVAIFLYFKEALNVMKITEDQSAVYFSGIKFVTW